MTEDDGLDKLTSELLDDTVEEGKEYELEEELGSTKKRKKRRQKTHRNRE